EGRKLANKLWNVARLMLTQAEGVVPDARPSSLEERWILSRLDEARVLIEDALPEFEFSAAVTALYHVTFDDFCDWYAEAIKPRLYDGDDDARATALAGLELLLELLHPVMPHVTEEIWSQFHDTRLIVAPWPQPRERDAAADGALERVRDAAAVFRRSGVLPAKLEPDEQRIFNAVVKPERQKAPVNADAERERLVKEIDRGEKMLANERFTANAPPEVVAAELEKLERYRRELDALGN
ncbi:MAG: valyl-tRNA synthetase, partial [Gaiellaceae bacterium]|nr:valyl-tRNA synthetase [Gaiellaceae bacterium]